jgi:hypothetical protein
MMSSLSDRIYRLLLHIYPVSFRRAYGVEMARLFRDDARRTRQAGGTIGMIGLWFLVLPDLLKTAFTEHIWEIFHMTTEKLQRWSGPAIAIGGPLWVVTLLWFVRSSKGSVRAIIPFIPFVLTAALIALGLVGLARRLPDRSRPRLLLAVTLGGLVVNNAAMLILFFATENPFGPRSAWGPEPIVASIVSGIGGAFLFGGLTIMGIASYTSKALGKLSAAPLLPPAAGIMIGLLIIFSAEIAGLFTAAYGVYTLGWILIGIALWNRHRDTPDLALPA